MGFVGKRRNVQHNVTKTESLLSEEFSNLRLSMAKTYG